MPQYRKIHVKITESFDVNLMSSDFVRLMWTWLPLVSCREGRGFAVDSWLKSRLFPLRDDIAPGVCMEALEELATLKLVVIYTLDKRPYYQILHWGKYQGDTSKEAASLYPPPPASLAPTAAEKEPDTLHDKDAARQLYDAIPDGIMGVYALRFSNSVMDFSNSVMDFSNLVMGLGEKVGEIYIGSSTNIRPRVREHLYNIAHGKHHCIPPEVLENGYESVSVEILEVVSKKGDLRSAERRVMAKFDPDILLNTHMSKQHPSWAHNSSTISPTISPTPELEKTNSASDADADANTDADTDAAAAKIAPPRKRVAVAAAETPVSIIEAHLLSLGVTQKKVRQELATILVRARKDTGYIDSWAALHERQGHDTGYLVTSLRALTPLPTIACRLCGTTLNGETGRCPNCEKVIKR